MLKNLHIKTTKNTNYQLNFAPILYHSSEPHRVGNGIEGHVAWTRGVIELGESHGGGTHNKGSCGSKLEI